MKLIEKAKDIYLIDGFLDKKQCENLISLSERIGYEPSSLRSLNDRKVNIKSLRNNYRVIYDDQNLANSLWSKMKAYFIDLEVNKSPIGFNERFRFYRYDVGEFFDWHSDGYIKKDNGVKSLYTLLFFLNDGFKGGETKFKKVTIQPTLGSVLVFKHNLLHQGAPVRRSRKYVLRTDILFSGFN